MCISITIEILIALVNQGFDLGVAVGQAPIALNNSSIIVLGFAFRIT